MPAPSNIGGAHWGGLAFDPARQIAVVAVNTVAAMVQLIPLDRVDTAEATRNASRFGDEYTRMHGTPFVMRRRLLFGPSRLPCTKPPFGSLVAIALRTGKQAWNVPLGNLVALGSSAAAPAAPLEKGDRGSPNLGGPIITAGGLSSGIDGALHVVARMLGDGVAQQVALGIEYDWRPRSGFARAALADRQIPDLDLDSLGKWMIVSTLGVM